MKTITLDFPVEVNGEKITELRMRRPKVKDIKIAKKQASQLEDDVDTALFANLCSQTPSVINELDYVDYMKVEDAYTGFLSQSGATSTPLAE